MKAPTRAPEPPRHALAHALRRFREMKDELAKYSYTCLGNGCERHHCSWTVLVLNCQPPS